MFPGNGCFLSKWVFLLDEAKWPFIDIILAIDNAVFSSIDSLSDLNLSNRSLFLNLFFDSSFILLSISWTFSTCFWLNGLKISLERTLVVATRFLTLCGSLKRSTAVVLLLKNSFTLDSCLLLVSNNFSASFIGFFTIGSLKLLITLWIATANSSMLSLISGTFP